jgi:hypothetical protein
MSKLCRSFNFYWRCLDILRFDYYSSIGALVRCKPCFILCQWIQRVQKDEVSCNVILRIGY